MSARPRPRPSGASSCAPCAPAAWSGVRLCVSDAHEGLKNAIGQVLGCPWQRCTVHFLRDMLGHVRPGPAADGRDGASARSSTPPRASRRASASARSSSAWPSTRPRSPSCSTDAEEDLLGLLRPAQRALDQAALDQPAGARQPRDRPALRRRRHLPQRRRPDPPRRRPARSSRTTSGWSAAATSRWSRSPWSSRTRASSTRRCPSWRPPERPIPHRRSPLHHVLGLDYSNRRRPRPAGELGPPPRHGFRFNFNRARPAFHAGSQDASARARSPADWHDRIL